MRLSEMELHYKNYIEAQEKKWKAKEEEIYQNLLKQGYFMWWAKEKAKQQILELRSRPENILKQTIPPEQTTQGDLD